MTEMISAAGTLLAGLAALIAALRPTVTRTPPPRLPRPPVNDPPRRPANSDADWTAAAYGGLALLLALALVTLRSPLGQDLGGPMLTLVRLAGAVPFALAVYFGVRTLREGLARKRRGLLISAGAGLTAAGSALATMLIIGSYGPANGF